MNNTPTMGLALPHERTTPGDEARTPTGSGPARRTLYSGHRRCVASVTWQLDRVPQVHSLNPRLDLVNHSPTGFEWGYLGSGPAQLAFALAMHVTLDESRARATYQQLKDQLIATLPKDESWTMFGGEVLDAIELIEAGRG